MAEWLGAVGLVIPELTNIAPVWTPLVAIGRIKPNRIEARPASMPRRQVESPRLIWTLARHAQAQFESARLIWTLAGHARMAR
nr:hypothetical protein [Cohnella algarum]